VVPHPSLRPRREGEPGRRKRGGEAEVELLPRLAEETLDIHGLQTGGLQLPAQGSQVAVDAPIELFLIEVHRAGDLRHGHSGLEAHAQNLTVLVRQRVNGLADDAGDRLPPFPPLQRLLRILSRKARLARKGVEVDLAGAGRAGRKAQSERIQLRHCDLAARRLHHRHRLLKR
jgi:hypothetical protein